MVEYSVFHSDDSEKWDRGRTNTLYDLMFDYADAFSFTVGDYWKNYAPEHLKRKANPLRESLKPHFVKKFHTWDWYGWVASDLDIFVYRCCPEAKAVLFELWNTLFNQKRRQRIPEFEDLCFYRKGELLLGTVSHEYMCTVFPTVGGEVFTEELLTIGAWRKGTSDCIYRLPK